MMMERMVEESNLKTLNLPVPVTTPSGEKKSFKSLVSTKVSLLYSLRYYDSHDDQVLPSDGGAVTGLVDWLKIRERSKKAPSKVCQQGCSTKVDNDCYKIPVAADANGQYEFADPCPLTHVFSFQFFCAPFCPALSKRPLFQNVCVSVCVSVCHQFPGL